MNFHIRDGSNLVSIGLSEIGSYFYFKKPLATVWYDCSGSLGKYLCLLPYAQEYRTQVRERLIGSLELDYTGNSEQLKILLDPLLKLFPNGEYSLNFYNGISGKYYEDNSLNNSEENKNTWMLVFSEAVDVRDKELKIKEHEKILKEHEGSKKYYPGDIISYTTNSFYEGSDIAFIATQPLSGIDLQRVKHFENEIKKGKRPFTIIFNCHLKELVTNADNSISDCSIYSDNYILDGHHKLKAYENLKINPPVVIISHLPKRRYEIEYNVEQLIEVLFPWQMKHILENWYDKEEHILEYLENPESKIHEFVKNGHVKEYHKNGQIKHEAFYINDHIEGEAKWWFENGRLQRLQFHKKKVRHGEWKEWYESGQIQFIQPFNENGQSSGHMVSYYQNGKIRWEQKCKNGINIDGYSYLTWYENGAKQAELKYLNGNLIKRKNYDQSGKLTSYEEPDAKTGKMMNRK